MPRVQILSAGLAALALSPLPAQAVTVDGWNTTNVLVPAGPYAADVTYASVIYDRDVTGGTAGASSSGEVIFTPPEATAPGIAVLTGAPDLSASQDIPNCIMASSSASCESSFQSGKRFKLHFTDTGAVDLVFDTSGTGESAYQLFTKFTNDVGAGLRGFTMELGFGVGDGFSLAGDGAGIAFAPVPDMPDTQFPFGLFGDAAASSNHDLDGFFAAETTGYLAEWTATKMRATTGYGPYGDLFGAWTTLDDAPWGYFWDHDGDAGTDAILMAWQTGTGEWEQRRAEDTGEAVPILPTIVGEADLISAGYLLGAIEDVSNLNVNAMIAFSDAFDSGSGFTLRITAAEVPLPAGAPLLVAGIGALGLLRRRR
ncbi:choice-of-anchor F family protein [Rhodovulum sp. DZ06]|uniref:choice-of-anchor F family protein n=1 Tax=Rhodovulum sp. DZ06 TaxID=3425126 RepID=UPI003D346D3B